MPIVDGRYEAKLSTTFATIDEGIQEIKKKMSKSRRVRLNGIPMKLLEELKPHLSDKDLMIILPLGKEPDPELKKLAPVATSKARIYVDYIGREANAGSVIFSDIVYNIVWAGRKFSIYLQWNIANV
jgi:hypothetical protein